MSLQLPTIIIPAHNEEKIISDTLDTLGAGTHNSFNILVVCNGCDDRTADIVHQNYPEVFCEEIEDASKILAIRHAESKNPGFPRIYLDADIGLSSSDAKRLLDAAAKTKKPQLILPASETNTHQSDYWVKAYYSVWYRSPYVCELGYGAGAYALNEEARKQFGEWPELIADDGFVRLHFNDREIQITPDVSAQVKAPKNFRGLLNIKTRSKYGVLQLEAYVQQEAILAQKHTAYGSDWLSHVFFKQPLKTFFYIMTNFIALRRAKRARKGLPLDWLRDESNR